MPANDQLILILEPATDGPHAVEWRRLSPLVTAMERGMGDAARALLVRRHVMVAPQNEVPSAIASVGGTLRPGSILLPLLFDLAQLAPIFAKPLLAGIEQPGELNRVLENLANTATVLDFCRGLMFGERGIVARLQGQNTTAAPGDEQERMIETAAPEFLEQLTASAIAMMEAAERTGCEEVKVRINDQSAISLMRSAPRRSRHLLVGRTGGPYTNVSTVIRKSPSVPVEFEGAARTAFVTETGAGSDPKPIRDVVVIWPANAETPDEGQQFEVQGRWIDRNDLTVLADIPDDWPATHGAFEVQRYKRQVDWQS